MSDMTPARLPVSTAKDVEIIGTMFARSGMFDCKTDQQGMILALNCHMSGMTPLQFLEQYHLIKGKPSKRSDAMLAALLELGGSHKLLERTPDRAEIEITFNDATGKFSLSFEDACKEPFVYVKKGSQTLKDNWATPRLRMQMLWARVVSDGCRTMCPASARLYTPEEVADMDNEAAPEPKNVTPEVMEVTPTPEAAAKTAQTLSNESTKVFETPEVLPPQPEPAAEIDGNIMPAGPMKGQPMESLTNKVLGMLVNTKKKVITPAHKAAVKAEIEKRKGEDQKADDYVRVPWAKEEKADAEGK